MAIYKNTPPIVTNGLLCNLDAGNRLSYPGSGTTWTDLSGNQNSGSLVSSPAFSSLDLGSITTNGSNNYVALPVNAAWNFGTSSFSLEVWFKAITGASFQNLLRYDTGLSAGLWWLQVSSTNANFIIYSSNRSTNTVIGVGGAFNDGNWHNVLAVRDSGSLMRMYYNGALGATGAEAAGINIVAGSGAYPSIGRLGSFNGEYAPFTVSNLRIYNRALSAQEAIQNYNALKSRFNRS